MQSTIPQSYRTDDLHQAAYIWCHGFEPRLEWVGPSKVAFVFDDTAASVLLGDYVRGEARVEPLRFSAALRELKPCDHRSFVKMPFADSPKLITPACQFIWGVYFWNAVDSLPGFSAVETKPPLWYKSIERVVEHAEEGNICLCKPVSFICYHAIAKMEEYPGLEFTLAQKPLGIQPSFFIGFAFSE